MVSYSRWPANSAGHDGANDPCDPQLAQEWLDRSGLDITQVARKSCLSVTQVRQLLHGTDGAFYSPAIRQRAYWRVMALLGAPAPIAPVAPAEPNADRASEPIHRPQDGASAELSVHPSPEPGSTVSPMVGIARRHTTHYTAWAWLGLLLLLGAATAEWWRGERVRAPDETTVRHAPPQEAVTAPPEVTTPSDVPLSGSEGALATSPSEPACAYVAQPVTTVMPALAEKPGNYVYVQARSEVEVCVIDGNHQPTQLHLKAGEHRSIYGQPPWQISGLDLNQINIYFQGWRVVLPEMATRQVALVERLR